VTILIVPVNFIELNVSLMRLVISVPKVVLPPLTTILGKKSCQRSVPTLPVIIKFPLEIPIAPINAGGKF